MEEYSYNNSLSMFNELEYDTTVYTPPGMNKNTCPRCCGLGKVSMGLINTCHRFSENTQVDSIEPWCLVFYPLFACFTLGRYGRECSQERCKVCYGSGYLDSKSYGNLAFSEEF